MVIVFYWPYSKSKLDLNSKKVELEWYRKVFVCVYTVSFFFALKARVQKLKFEFCQTKWG